MTNLEINEIRKILIEELEKHEGEPVLLPLEPHVLQEIIFDVVLPTKCKEFSLNLKSVLKKIDFSNVPFNDVYLRLCNFEGLKGIKINPQVVYKKDLSNCKFNGVTFAGSFDGTICSNADFTGSTGVIINPQKIANKNLCKSKLSGVKFIGKFNDVLVMNADFTGSEGAIINLAGIAGSDLSGTNLCDVTVKGNTNRLTLNYTCFKGAKTINGEMININPQTIKERKMIYCNFDGVYFTNDFDGCTVAGSNFKGSEGAIINAQKLKDKSLIGTVLSNVTLEGNFDNVRVNNADFTGSIGAVINPQTVYDKNLTNSIFHSVTFDGFFDNCKIKNSNFTGSINAIINPRSIYCRNLINVNLTDAIVVDNFKGLFLTDNMVMCQKENLIDDNYNNMYEDTKKEYVIRMIKSLFK